MFVKYRDNCCTCLEDGMFFVDNDKQWMLRFAAVGITVADIVSKSGDTVSGKFCAGAVTCS